MRYAVWMGDKSTAKYHRGRRMKEAGFDEQQCRPANPKLRLEDLEQDGISAEVIYGIRFVEDSIKDPEVVTATFQAYNDFIAEFCEAGPERLIGIGVIPAHSPAAAAAELRRLGAGGLGLKGALFDWFNACEPVWHSMWEPMWEAAEEARVAISFHIGFGQGTTTVGLKDRLSADETNPISVAAHLAVCAMQADEVLASMLVGGMLERYAGLKIVMAESHIGWIPYLLQRMDRKFDEGDYTQWCKVRPSELFRRQVLGHLSRRPRRLPAGRGVWPRTASAGGRTIRMPTGPGPTQDNSSKRPWASSLLSCERRSYAATSSGSTTWSERRRSSCTFPGTVGDHNSAAMLSHRVPFS